MSIAKSQLKPSNTIIYHQELASTTMEINPTIPKQVQWK